MLDNEIVIKRVLEIKELDKKVKELVLIPFRTSFNMFYHYIAYESAHQFDSFIVVAVACQDISGLYTSEKDKEFILVRSEQIVANLRQITEQELENVDAQLENSSGIEYAKLIMRHNVCVDILNTIRVFYSNCDINIQMAVPSAI